MTRNGIYLNLFAYDSVLKIFCLGYFDQNGNSSDEYEFCVELNGKEPKNIQFKKIEFDAWYAVVILR